MSAMMRASSRSTWSAFHDVREAFWVISSALTATPPAFGAEHVGRLRAAGIDDAGIVDQLSGAAFFNWANRLMLSLGEPEVV